MSRFFVLAAVCLTLVACSSSPGGYEAAMDLAEAELAAAGGVNGTFKAHPIGDHEVPANDSRAQAQAVFRLSKDGTELHYRLNVANIENVTMAHIHLAPAGANGPIVAWLYPAAPPAALIPGRTQGRLRSGTLTSASLLGTLAGQPLSALVDAMRAGTTYVNVHTSQFPGGEVRDQIR